MILTIVTCLEKSGSSPKNIHVYYDIRNHKLPDPLKTYGVFFFFKHMLNFNFYENYSSIYIKVTRGQYENCEITMDKSITVKPIYG